MLFLAVIVALPIIVKLLIVFGAFRWIEERYFRRMEDLYYRTHYYHDDYGDNYYDDYENHRDCDEHEDQHKTD